MEIDISQLAEIIGGKIRKVINQRFVGIATLKNAQNNDISFFYDRRYMKDLFDTKAGVVVVQSDIKETVIEKINASVISVDDPLIAMKKIIDMIKSEEKKPSGIHPTALVSERTTLGKNVSIGEYTVIKEYVTIGDSTIIEDHCFISSNTKIGNSCIIRSGVKIMKDTQIGDRVIIHPGCVIGADGFGYVLTPEGYVKIPQIGNVVIEDDVEIGANVTIDRATMDSTIIKKGTKIDNLVHIAHNVIIGRECMIAAQVGIAGSVVIGDRVLMGGQAGIKDHVKIGNDVKIGAQAGVTNDIKDKIAVSGYPAREHRKMLKIHAIMNNLPKLWEELKKWRNKKQ